MKSLFFNLKPVPHNYSDLFKTKLNGPHRTTNKRPVLLPGGKIDTSHTELLKFSLIDKTMSQTITVSDAVNMLTTANTIK